MNPPLQPASADSRLAQDPLLAAVLGAMGVAVFTGRDGEFRLAGRAPEWLQRVAPEIASQNPAVLADRFPLLEAFYPEAEAAWSGESGAAYSDLWTETLPDGTDVHLQACALCVAGQPCLAIVHSDALYREHQLVLQYAHDTALQNDTISRLNRE